MEGIFDVRSHKSYVGIKIVLDVNLFSPDKGKSSKHVQVVVPKDSHLATTVH